MFGNIPPFSIIRDNNIPASVITPFNVFHTTVNNEDYISLGEMRKKEKHCIFHYTVKGHGQVIYKGNSYITSPGEGFFNIINQNNSGYCYPKSQFEPWEFVVICFDGGNVRQIVGELLDKRVVYKVNMDKFSFMCKMLLDNTLPDTYYTFFPKLVCEINLDMPTYQVRIDESYNRLVERELLNNPTVAALASQLKMSREHLQREYAKQTGITPANYLSCKRFEMLCSFLEANMTDYEICQKMKFTSVLSMNAFFKRYTGVTIRKYRQSRMFFYNNMLC